MKSGYILNPVEEYVNNVKQRVKDNGGYCLYADKNSKKNKCPKYCKAMPDCPCDMYIQESTVTDE